MSAFELVILTSKHHDWPSQLTTRLESAAPANLTALGNLSILANRKIALFCSARCPGDAILNTFDLARRWRDEGLCVISGFHSPIERECLRILLRGQQPIIVCPARSIKKMQIPANWKKPLANGRLLVLSCFSRRNRRVTADLAVRRNEFVAALADDVFFARITPGGRLEQLSKRCATWGVPEYVLRET